MSLGLFLAAINQATSFTDYHFTLFIYDEDKDLDGFVIKEEHVNDLGQREIIEDTYPLFTHFTPLDIFDTIWFPFHPRTESDRKDEALWGMFLENRMNIAELNIGDYPPIYISTPDDDKITVWVWLYDKLGNKSNEVKLLNLNQNATKDENSQAHEK